MYRGYEALFPVLEELQIGFVAFSPLANGLLSGAYSQNSTFSEQGDYRKAMPQFQAGSYEKNKALLSLIQRYADDKNATNVERNVGKVVNQQKQAELRELYHLDA